MHPDGFVFERIHETLLKARRILLVSDGKPDGDSLGSTSAALNWLLREGKDVTAFCAAPIPSVFRYLDNIHRFTDQPEIFNQAYDVIMTFDAGDLRHCGIDTLLPKTPSGYTLIVMDHHATNARYGMINAVLTDACSTAEVLYRFFEHLRIDIDSYMATSLLSGILTDTSCFSNAATTTFGMDAAGKLFSCGARHGDILRHLIHNQSISGLKLWGTALSRLTHHPKLDLAVTYLRAEDLEGEKEEAYEGLANFLGAACSGADTILILKELSNGTIKGSLRSSTRDISKLAQFLGGGGHKKAAGFTVKGRLVIEGTSVKVVQ